MQNITRSKTFQAITGFYISMIAIYGMSKANIAGFQKATADVLNQQRINIEPQAPRYVDNLLQSLLDKHFIKLNPYDFILQDNIVNIINRNIASGKVEQTTMAGLIKLYIDLLKDCDESNDYQTSYDLYIKADDVRKLIYSFAEES